MTNLVYQVNILHVVCVYYITRFLLYNRYCKDVGLYDQLCVLVLLLLVLYYLVQYEVVDQPTTQRQLKKNLCIVYLQHGSSSTEPTGSEAETTSSQETEE